MNESTIQQLAKQYLDYDMIRIHTELPDFPEYRIRLLTAVLNMQGTPKENSELYALVTSLVQIGMDTHDLVPLSNERKDKPAARSRQLQVLAGDYFSSRYYNLLAQAGEIEMIRQLANSVCEVNRLKMNLYSLMKQLKVTAEDYIQQTVAIKMELFLPFRKRMAGLAERFWPDILHRLTECEVIAGEIGRMDSPLSFKESWAYWQLMQAGSKEERRQLQADKPDPGKIRALLLKYNTGAQLTQMLENSIQLLWSAVKPLHSDLLNRELSAIGERLSLYLNRPKVLKEY